MSAQLPCNPNPSFPPSTPALNPSGFPLGISAQSPLPEPQVFPDTFSIPPGSPGTREGQLLFNLSPASVLTQPK